MRYLILMLVAAASYAAEIQPTPLPEADSETVRRKASVRTVPAARTFRFEPKADITTDELARLNPYLNGKPLHEADRDALGSAMRHLRELN